MPTHTIIATSDIARFAASGAFPPLDPAYVAAGQADEHLLALDAQGSVRARASLWWSHTPPLPHERVGCIGHYAAETRDAAASLLAHATMRLQQAGCTLALAPIDGSTFRRYRFVVQHNNIQHNDVRDSIDGMGHPPFFLEPENPKQWPQDLCDAGFSILADYVSAIADLQGPDERLEQARAKAAAHGVCVHALDPARFDETLERIFPVIMQAFQANLLFAPISQAEFMGQYAPMRDLLQPDLILLAEREGELVGFLFALPDLAQAQRGEPIDTVIFKTLAVLPAVAGLGIGSLLAAQAHTNAYKLGYRRAIHALMHSSNRSRRISSHYATPMRRYALFARPLPPSPPLP